MMAGEVSASVTPFKPALFYSINELLEYAGLGTPESYVAAMRADVAAMTGPDARASLEAVEKRIAGWMKLSAHRTCPENREAIRKFLDGLADVLREVRVRLVAAA